jgi:hypothetical protein
MDINSCGPHPRQSNAPIFGQMGTKSATNTRRRTTTTTKCGGTRPTHAAYGTMGTSNYRRTCPTTTQGGATRQSQHTGPAQKTNTLLTRHISKSQHDLLTRNFYHVITPPHKINFMPYTLATIRSLYKQNIFSKNISNFQTQNNFFCFITHSK